MKKDINEKLRMIEEMINDPEHCGSEWGVLSLIILTAQAELSLRKDENNFPPELEGRIDEAIKEYKNLN